MTQDTINQLIDISYLLASISFILGLKDLSHPRTARRGMFLAALGMVIAVAGTMFHGEIRVEGYAWIVLGLVIGSLVGAPLAIWIPMTAVPQRTALSHAFGALAVALVGVSKFLIGSEVGHEMGSFKVAAIGFEVILGTLTFTGSLVAAGKLQGVFPGAPMTFKGQNFFNMLILAGMLGVLCYLVYDHSDIRLFYALVGMGLLFGILFVLPIGAADMPVLIAILNAYGGLAASATGFVLNNKVLIIAGALDGGSGLLLSLLMCKAMNRSWSNVLFGAFGQQADDDSPAGAAASDISIRELSAADVAATFSISRRVIVVPGYGMAVAQAQHKVKELADLCAKLEIEVKYAIHPVAGRMPGHMNVLLAEANVPYDQLFDMDDINSEFSQTDIALVIGANDVTNPAARTVKSSPIYGMPILNVDKAQTVIVVKRSMKPGFAGIDNELYGYPNCYMYFGDAKDAVAKLVTELKSLESSGH